MNTQSNSQPVRRVSSKELISKLVQLAQKRVQRGCLLKPGTYQRYIDYLRTKPTTPETERHHIIPKHMEGGNEPSNIIEISVREHILAHLLLYLEQGGQGNLLAYTIRQSTQHYDLKIRSKLTDFMNKIMKKGWYNPEVQSKLGKLGGRLGGTRNTTAQREARSKVGETYGRATGLSNQSEALKDRLQTTLVFQHKDAKNQAILVANQESVIDIARYINQECEKRGIEHLKLNLDRIKSGGPFYGLVKKTQKNAYGWTILEEFRLEEFID